MDNKKNLPRTNWPLAIPAVLFLGPLGLVTAALAIVALVSTFIAGLDPTHWFSPSGGLLDTIAGGGADSGVRYLTFMVCGVTSSLCWAGIQRAFGND